MEKQKVDFFINNRDIKNRPSFYTRAFATEEVGFEPTVGY